MSIHFNKAEFVLSAVRPEGFIRDGLHQLAFAGRSNVGKSSVINRVVGRKNFARVGAARARPPRSTTSASTGSSIWWICRATVTPRSPRLSGSGGGN